jgi:Fe-S-cluster containining protein
MIIQLSKNYRSRYGTPAIDRVDTSIFERKYFAYCMSCNFCNDWCCWHGADVDVHNAHRITALTEELERYTGVPREEWFDESQMCEDEEAPGQLWWRTSNSKGACVFLNRNTRGCMLHSFALQQNMDYHDLKPLVCSIFPLTFEEGLLVHADEVEDKELVCTGEGPSLYSGVRSELLYYFGQELVEELDSLNTSY